jgi:hypothetical protein
VALSFFYQPGGRGDMPEYNDLLRLEFFSSSANEWNTVWTASANQQDSTITEEYYLLDIQKQYKGSIDSVFRYVALAVNEARYLNSGFRFRFSNMASMAASPIPGRESNCDHWHLDFVYLNRNRSVSDTLLPDVAISEPQPPITRTYTSIPARHLRTTDARQKLFGNPMQFSLTYRNLGWGTRNITRRFSITPLQGSNLFPQDYSGGTENIFDGQVFVRDYSFEPYDFTDINPAADSAAFEIKSYLVTDTDASPLRVALRHNDTTSYIQKFYNYYSYDDGTAETGYGLTGTGSSSGKVAVRFTAFDTDSLRALSVYFNLARDSSNAKPFRLTVWADDNGVPGSELFAARVTSPTFSDELNRFVTYKLPEAIEIRRGQVFYIGWVQQSETYLNVGYDVNCSNPGVNFYNIGNVWTPSVYDGALMLRPVFGKAAGVPDDALPLPTPPPPASKTATLVLFPNPVRDVMNLRYTTGNNEYTIPPECTVVIYDLNKQLVFTTVTGNGSVSVPNLQGGVYIVCIFENNRLVATREILKIF